MSGISREIIEVRMPSPIYYMKTLRTRSRTSRLGRLFISVLVTLALYGTITAVAAERAAAPGPSGVLTEGEDEDVTRMPAFNVRADRVEDFGFHVSGATIAGFIPKGAAGGSRSAGWVCTSRPTGWKILGGTRLDDMQGPMSDEVIAQAQAVLRPAQIQVLRQIQSEQVSQAAALQSLGGGMRAAKIRKKNVPRVVRSLRMTRQADAAPQQHRLSFPTGGALVAPLWSHHDKRSRH